MKVRVVVAPVMGAISVTWSFVLTPHEAGRPVASVRLTVHKPLLSSEKNLLPAEVHKLLNDQTVAVGLAGLRPASWNCSGSLTVSPVETTGVAAPEPIDAVVGHDDVVLLLQTKGLIGNPVT